MAYQHQRAPVLITFRRNELSKEKESSTFNLLASASLTNFSSSSFFFLMNFGSSSLSLSLLRLFFFLSFFSTELANEKVVAQKTRKKKKKWKTVWTTHSRKAFGALGRSKHVYFLYGRKSSSSSSFRNSPLVLIATTIFIC